MRFGLILFFALTPLLTAVAAVRNARTLSRILLTRQEHAEHSEDFGLEGVVSYILTDNRQISLLLEDASGATYIKTTKAKLKSVPVPGDCISINGCVTIDRLSDIQVSLTDTRILRHGSAPQPIQISAGQIETGEIDWRRARIRGFVRDVLPSETNKNWIYIVLIADGQTVYVSIPLNGTPPQQVTSLIGTDVAIDGFCNPLDGSTRHYQGRIFQCAGIPSVSVIPSSRSDPFSAPSLESIRHLNPSTIATLGYRKVSGHVIAVWRGREALIGTKCDEIVHVICDGGATPRPGDFIEVAGFPLSDLFHITLTHALWRTTAPWKLSQNDPVELSATSFASRNGWTWEFTKLHGRAVRITGTVRNLPDETVRPGTLLLETPEAIVSIDVGDLSDPPPSVRMKSTVEITGTFVLETEIWRPDRIFPQIHGFRIIVNDRNGITVIAQPPWWTAGRLWTALVILLILLIAIFIWNRTLNRLAERRGHQLLREQTKHMKAELKTEERTRLAVELHDSLAQNLTGVSMEIETAQRCGSDNITELMRHLNIADKALKSCRHELRNTLWDLRSQALEERDITAAIRRTLLPHMKGIRLSIRFNVSRRRLADNFMHELLRIIRELTLNGIRHGKATEIRIAGSLDGNVLLISVRDNGSGFDPETCPDVTEGHFGLQGIRERLRVLSGQITFSKIQGNGTKALVTIPLTPPDNEGKPCKG